MSLLIYMLFCVLIIHGNIYCLDVTQTIIEGKDLYVLCPGNSSKGQTIYWKGRTSEFHEDGPQLNITAITRNFTGEYDCFKENLSTNKTKPIFSVYVDVLYPAKILSTNVTKSTLEHNESFEMTVAVEGNDLPETKLTAMTSGNVKFDSNKVGILTVNFTVSCDDMDTYILTCSNNLNTAEWKLNITVLCAAYPDPRHPFNLTITPRLGESATLDAYVKGYPPPSFHWWQGTTELTYHTDTEFSTQLQIKSVKVENFGTIMLKMSNEVGNSTINYSVTATGPPEPVTHFIVKNVSDSSAYLTWTTGYDYNASKSFVVTNEADGKQSELQTFPDGPDDLGGKYFGATLTDLQSIQEYTLSVIARNIRGNATGSPNATFTTLGAPKPSKPPNDTFSPRVGENIVMEIFSVGNPPPSFSWTFNGNPVQHQDSNQYSSVHLNINPQAFGSYTLTMQNSVGKYTHQYNVNAEGPPEPVTDFVVKNFSDSSAYLTWTTGYDYNATQSFVIINKADGKQSELQTFPDGPDDLGGKNFAATLIELQSIQEYTLSVIARNARGDATGSPTAAPFTTLGHTDSEALCFIYAAEKTTGAPKPSKPPSDTFSPRVGANIVMEIFSVGNPPPSFSWTFNGNPVQHQDSNQYSSVHLSINPQAFGSYTLSMQNSVGKYTHQYNVNAEGPPDPCTDLHVTGVTISSAQLSWQPGFDYGAVQTFIIISENGGQQTELDKLQSTQGNMNPVSHMIQNLNPGSAYTLQVKSSNSRGDAAGMSNQVQFSTDNPTTTTTEPNAAPPIHSFELSIITVFVIVSWSQRMI